MDSSAVTKSLKSFYLRAVILFPAREQTEAGNTRMHLALALPKGRRTKATSTMTDEDAAEAGSATSVSSSEKDNIHLKRFRNLCTALHDGSFRTSMSIDSGFFNQSSHFWPQAREVFLFGDFLISKFDENHDVSGQVVSFVRISFIMASYTRFSTVASVLNYLMRCFICRSAPAHRSFCPCPLAMKTKVQPIWVTPPALIHAHTTQTQRAHRE